MAAAVFRLGRIAGIDRPALPAHFVTATGPVMLLDVGANMDSDAENLVQFAAMGAIFAEHVLDVPNPRIGLLNIGEETEKGDELAREAHAKLAALDLHFVGNVEAHDMIAHRADVVVCDGFVGNVVIKFFEGLTSYIFRSLREDLQQGPIAPLALLALKPGFDRHARPLRLRALRRRAAARGEGSEHRHARAGEGADDRERHPGGVGVGARATCRELIVEWTREHPALAHRGVRSRIAARLHRERRPHRDEPSKTARRDAADPGCSPGGSRSSRSSRRSSAREPRRPRSSASPTEREVPDEVRDHAARSWSGWTSIGPSSTRGSPPRRP